LNALYISNDSMDLLLVYYLWKVYRNDFDAGTCT